MNGIKVEEVSGYKTKTSKYESYLKSQRRNNALKFAITFAISVILMRVITLWILKMESSLTFKEILFNRYYYGSESIGLLKYMEKFFEGIVPEFFWIFLDNATNYKYNFIVSLIGGIISLIVLLAIMIVMYISVPFVYMIMKFISIMDAIIPVSGNLYMWWFIYLAIFGFGFAFKFFIGGKIINENSDNKQPSNVWLKDFFCIKRTIILVIILLFVSLIGIKFIGNEFRPEVTNSYNIKKLVDSNIINE